MSGIYQKYFFILGLIFLLPNISLASVQAVVVTTEYKQGNWQPLPADKIKQAGMYPALQKISASKRFAFFKNKPKGTQAGQLTINVSLVEAAQTATVNVTLALPGQATHVSTHSTSLKNQFYGGIYRQFQLASEIAGKKLIDNYLKQLPVPEYTVKNKTMMREIAGLNARLIRINNLIIQKSNNSNISKRELDLKAVVKDLNKIDRVLMALKKQDAKLDVIIDEVGQINTKIDQTPRTQVNINQKYILDNAVTGSTKIPAAQNKGADERVAQDLYNRAQTEKRSSNYTRAEKLLFKALSLQVSPELKTLISDELFYHLPMFEAQAIAIELGGDFKKYSSQNKHKHMLSRIRSRYEYALANNQNNFQRTRQIQHALDQHINTSRAMSATLSFQSRSNFTMLHRQMEQQMMMRGEYPDRKGFEDLLGYTRLQHKVISYKTKKYGYNASLRTLAGEVVKMSYDGRNFKIEE